MIKSQSLHGEVIAFEGPDGVGKSSLSEMLCSYLLANGISAAVFSFPGKESSQLGSWVYDFHHRASAGEVELDSFSLQLLHVAAHIDMLKRFILPQLERGTCVILDRYWWSLLVYGVHSTVNEDHLRSLVEIEKPFWKGLTPRIIFLLSRETQDARTVEIDKLYKDMFVYGSNEGNVEPLHNVSLQETFEAVIKVLKDRGLLYDLD